MRCLPVPSAASAGPGGGSAYQWSGNKLVFVCRGVTKAAGLHVKEDFFPGDTERCERPFGPPLASQPGLARSTGEDVSVCDVASRPALPRPRPRPQPLSPSLHRRQEAKTVTPPGTLPISR